MNLSDHQNTAPDIAADTGSPVMNDNEKFFPSALSSCK